MKKPISFMAGRGKRITLEEGSIRLSTWCSVCRSYDCGTRYNNLPRRAVIRLLKMRIGEGTRKIYGGYSCSRRSGGRFLIGCQRLTLTPAQLAKVRRWAAR